MARQGKAFLPTIKKNTKLSTKKTFSVFSETNAFTFTCRHLSSRGGGRNEYDNDGYEEALLKNKKRTCIQHFLSQRSFQSFMTLLTELKDPHTSDWIERFLDASSLLDYHGTGAFNMTRFESWDSYYLEMAKQPKEIVIVQTLRNSARSFRGGSKNNPFLNQEKHHVEVQIDINPSSLVPRVLSVREQIAREMVGDFEILINFNDNSKLNQVEYSICCDDIQILLTLLLINPNAVFSSLWYHYHIIILYHIIICRSVIPSYEYKVKHKGNYKVDTVFDRSTAMIALTSKMAMDTFAPNPLRKTTFDLLLLLALQESIHRVLREYRDSGDEIEKAVSFEWLREYYTDRVDDYFDGFQYLGRAEDFIEELLLVPPSVINIDGGTRTAVVDTQKIASDLVEMRSLVFLDWRDIIQRVPEEHVALRQCVLVQQAKGWAENIASSELDAAVGGEDSLGAFE